MVRLVRFSRAGSTASSLRWALRAMRYARGGHPLRPEDGRQRHRPYDACPYVMTNPDRVHEGGLVSSLEPEAIGTECVAPSAVVEPLCSLLKYLHRAAEGVA